MGWLRARESTRKCAEAHAPTQGSIQLCALPSITFSASARQFRKRERERARGREWIGASLGATSSTVDIACSPNAAIECSSTAVAAVDRWSKSSARIRCKKEQCTHILAIRCPIARARHKMHIALQFAANWRRKDAIWHVRCAVCRQPRTALVWIHVALEEYMGRRPATQ